MGKAFRKISPEAFITRIEQALGGDKDLKIVWFIGAGCSVTSGVKAAGKMVLDWLNEGYEKYARSIGEEACGKNELRWIHDNYPDYREDEPAKSYGNVIEGQYPDPQLRQAVIDDIISGKMPGFGYIALAGLLTHPNYGDRMNVVLTTNFDDLVADALYLNTDKKPLVVLHDSLMNFATVSRARPLVVKLHGDVRLPTQRHTPDETAKLDAHAVNAVKQLVDGRYLVFMGYGGNDKSIARALEQANPRAVYWIRSSRPDGPLFDWLEEKEAWWVPHSDFDHLMLLAAPAFGMKVKPNNKRFEIFEKTCENSIVSVKNRLMDQDESPIQKATKVGLKYVAKGWGGDLEVILDADQKKEETPRAALNALSRGIKEYPQSQLLKDQYASYLYNVEKKAEKADKKFQELLANDSQNPGTLAGYAAFLFAQGDKEQGKEFLYKCFKLLDGKPGREPLLLQCLFLKYAHLDSVRAARKKTLLRIRQLLNEGVRAPLFYPLVNVEKAKRDGFSEPAFLSSLGNVITGHKDLDQLSKHTPWLRLKYKSVNRSRA